MDNITQELVKIARSLVSSKMMKTYDQSSGFPGRFTLVWEVEADYFSRLPSLYKSAKDAEKLLEGQKAKDLRNLDGEAVQLGDFSAFIQDGRIHLTVINRLSSDDESQTIQDLRKLGFKKA